MVLADDPTIAVAPGAEWVQVHVKYMSHAHTVLNFNEAQFAVSNGAVSCGDCMYPKAGTYFTVGDPSHAGYALAPGATVESDIVFEIPKSEHDVRLLYRPDGMEDIAAFWWQLGI